MSEVCILRCKHPSLEKFIKSCPNKTIRLSWSQHIKSKNLQNSSPVFLSSSAVRPICFVNKSNTAIFYEAIMII